ncbi:uncharacterized protein EKO05_0006091 [Ascochyta rabiei]|uniref:Uncharacterized protein n=1 Tax=Didymella rabiei TaxID=5454 RepID=A0A163MK75_DIDRA|nr:uncharacterized protein EKO05_0006091 [Ascochyta rabiei]KZM28788.1 hypothetical protein ST47_g79 [Ascochyta rabiei]UPX15649.1 hypothetical protein EKO05_0006091 [Ascochyta rabiei]
MYSYLPTLLMVGTLGSLVAADNIYTYVKPGCAGSAFFFKDIDHNVCALSITSNSTTSIADAIAKNVTLVHSSKLEVQETGKKQFIGWDQGPDSNSDGLLQCGHIIVNKAVKDRETCIDGTLHGVSWTEPGDDKRKRDAFTCSGSTEPDAVFLNGKHYTTNGIPEEDAGRLKELVFTDGNDVPNDLLKYEFTPNV